MAVSTSTAEAVIDVLLKYVSREVALSIANELTKVPGNMSFRLSMDLVRRLAHQRLQDKQHP